MSGPSKKERLARGAQTRKARRRHLVHQGIREQLKLLKMGETVEVTAFVHGRIRSIQVRPIAKNELPEQVYVLLVHNRRLVAEVAYLKDGYRVDGRHIQLKDVLGVVETPIET